MVLLMVFPNPSDSTLWKLRSLACGKNGDVRTELAPVHCHQALPWGQQNQCPCSPLSRVLCGENNKLLKFCDTKMDSNKRHWECPGGSALGLSPEDAVSPQWKSLSRGGMLPSQKYGGINVASLFPWGSEKTICPVGRARATQVLSRSAFPAPL